MTILYYSLIYVGVVTAIMFLTFAGVIWAWDYGWKWGRRDAEKKWKREHGV